MTAEEKIKAIAERHNIVFQRSDLDDYCKKITELSGDVVESDEIENLLIAIRRAKVADGKELTCLHFQYMQERDNQNADAA